MLGTKWGEWGHLTDAVTYTSLTDCIVPNLDIRAPFGTNCHLIGNTEYCMSDIMFQLKPHANSQNIVLIKLVINVTEARL